MKQLFFAFTFLASTIIIYAQQLTWAKGIGGTSADGGVTMTTDASGGVYTTGFFTGTVDFDPGTGVSNLTALASSGEMFILKLDANGNFVWARKIGGTSGDVSGNSITFSSGMIYISGYFTGTVDFDPSTGVANLTSAGGADAFILKLDASGNFVWGKSIGGSTSDISQSIITDNSGNIYATGSFESTVDFDPGTGTSNLVSAGSSDIFVLKLDGSGNFAWAKRIGGTLGETGYSLALDPSGNIYSTGTFGGTVDFDPSAGTSNISSNGAFDVYVLKLDVSGNFAWAKAFGGSGYELCMSIVLDATGNVFTGGSFSGTVDFDPGSGTANLVPTGSGDLFISKLDANGNYVWAKNFGGTSFDYLSSISSDATGNIYAGGNFNSTVDFDPSAIGTTNLTSSGSNDIFALKLNASGNFVWAVKMGGALDDQLRKITVDASGKVYTTGLFNGTADFDPMAGVSNLTSMGGADIYTSKMTQSGTGISNYSNTNNLTIYPNPNNGSFIINTPEEGVYSINNSLGQCIQYFESNSSNHYSVHFSGLTNGIYYIRKIDEERIIMKKIIVLN